MKKLSVIFFAIVLIVSLQTTSYADLLESPIAPVYSDIDSSDTLSNQGGKGSTDKSPYAPKTSDNALYVMFYIMAAGLLSVGAFSKKVLVEADVKAE